MISPPLKPRSNTYDFIIIGSGFGGSVSALRLSEKGYRVLVIEKGKDLQDKDFATSNWKFWQYLWNPLIRSFGILQMSLLNGMLILHGAGVGGGSLGYANVLMEPEEKVFDAPPWQKVGISKEVLQPYYQTAKRMLGVTRNPKLFASDLALQRVANSVGKGDTFSNTDVGVFFGKEGQEGQSFPDPFFNGKGPDRNACEFCGGCMVGCRHNAKNTLVKNYLHLAQKNGVEIMPESMVLGIESLVDGGYQLTVSNSTKFIKPKPIHIQADNIVFSAGVMGTVKLLLSAQQDAKTLPNLSTRLGENTRTNNEALLGAVSRTSREDFSKGIAIGSVFNADDVTRIEPVKYPAKSGFMRLLSWPLIDSEKGFISRLLQLIWRIVTRPIDFLSNSVFPKWAERASILLVMQTLDNKMKVGLGRSIWTGFKKGLIVTDQPDGPIPTKIEHGHETAKAMAKEMGGFPAGSIAEGLFGMPSTAHIMGGCPMGATVEDGVIDAQCRVHNYLGLYVIDGSIMPGNPGINPSLTITALAEYANSFIEKKGN
jgi:cholesterol oxidase